MRGEAEEERRAGRACPDVGATLHTTEGVPLAARTARNRLDRPSKSSRTGVVEAFSSGKCPGAGPGTSRKWLYLVLEAVAEPDEVVVEAVVVGGGEAHLPSTGSTSPWRLWALRAWVETVILTNFPDLPALWQIVTFLSACLALPLPCSEPEPVVPFVVVVDAAASFFPLPLPPPLSASAYEDALH